MKDSTVKPPSVTVSHERSIEVNAKSKNSRLSSVTRMLKDLIIHTVHWLRSLVGQSSSVSGGRGDLLQFPQSL